MAPFIFILILVIAGAVTVRAFRKRLHRLALLQKPLSDHQWAIIHAQAPLIRRLPSSLSDAFAGKVNLFLDQVDFVGGGDLEITDEMKLSIAAQACVLIANSDAWYTSLRTVIVYPSAFKSRQARHEGFVVRESEEVRSGESWTHGPVILSWAHSRQGGLNEFDGHNVVLHEFAHQLDALSGATNAVPLLGKGQSFVEWERTILKAYEDHVEDVARGRKTVLDAYGAQDHVEFFAVSIEVFFEKPAQLQSDFPLVYEQLSKLLSLDPASWTA